MTNAERQAIANAAAQAMREAILAELNKRAVALGSSTGGTALAGAAFAIRSLPLPASAEAASPAAGWRPIAEKPDDVTLPMLVCQGNRLKPDFGEITVARWKGHQYGWRVEGCEDRLYWEPTHYASLPSGPSPPTTERARGG